MAKRILAILFIMFSACNQEKTTVPAGTSGDSSNTPKVNDEFQTFIDKFPEIKLPLTIESCNYDVSKLKKLSDESYIVGKFTTNGNLATITLAAADCFLPILTTYKLTGEKIDSKEIAIGYCDDGPCYECKEYMTIDKTFKLYNCDTIKSYNCDENYNEIMGTERIEVIYKRGSLKSNGKIELSSELKKEF